ncbi:MULTISPECIES: MbtH family NRPS accessory protein [unclassified Caballeronia]|jgi:MbtH protein|uniref:MbtH family protein n=1 Tax=unclassified Caballeronia TaxID=2646786 RepID=UPI00285778DA|nr:MULTISPECIES: MbtH family NRPS accessory protein [unclassified Caballeronia]MDR5753402.1 MbtH family NRPS accessory protein [Caballeronia sp. LZ024]MDR5841141.1 MbtH family NRPS accessory protein [Caballeronia sp. LZ031]
MTQAQPSTTAVAANEADDLVYTVVVNDEEQYSIWPTFRAIPAGWREAGVRGPKADCLAYIETAWTDMRPASLRRYMDDAAHNTRAS